MTREEASNILDDYDVNFEGHTAEEIAKAFDVAFRALEEEPCEDAISRQAVEEIINDIRNCISVEGYWAILERMKKLPSVKPQEPKWIPVSERLPEIQRGVLLELRNGDILTGFKSETEPYFYVIGVDECYVEPINVIAWMPLPKPYEPQERSDKE